MLSAPTEEFVKLWFEQGEGLVTGAFPNWEAYIRHVCRNLVANVEDYRIKYAASLPFNLTKKMIMLLRDDALDVLTQLKSNGLKIGVISDCGPDVPEIWHETPLCGLVDIAIFSCSVGTNKADIGIFQSATEELGVQPKDCVYVADGNRQELSNAAKLGMYSIRISVPDEETYENPLREKWDGHTVSTLTEVLKFVIPSL
jgi:putative hydrolase of the HAD superfamily